MVTLKEYNQKPETYWAGKKVRTLTKLNNGLYEIPAGTILIIHRKYCGFSLEGLEICPHCKIGRKISISRVEPDNIELVEASNEAS